ncbi:hypothetical protein [Clostridium sp. Marseille-Q7071]
MRTMLILLSLSVIVISGVVYIAYEKIKYAYKKRNDEIEILKRNLDINNLLIEKKLNEINEMLDIDNITFNSTLKKEYEATRNIVNISINAAISSVHEPR